MDDNSDAFESIGDVGWIAGVADDFFDIAGNRCGKGAIKETNVGSLVARGRKEFARVYGKIGGRR